MNKRGNTLVKIESLLLACILGAILSSGINLLVYRAVNSVAKNIGKDTVPSIVAANHINALLADAHSNAMNAMVTGEKSGGKFWTLYRADMLELHSRLLDISRNNVFGEGEHNAILAIMSNVSAYEYTLGGAVSNGTEISVDQFGEANRLMQQKILPASVALNKIYSSYLNAVYNRFIKSINGAIVLMVVIALFLLVILLFTQHFLLRSTHRIFNIGLVLASVLFAVNIIYSTSTLNSVKNDLYTAKHNAFDSIQALWGARATAYNANALESLYLLHNGTGIVQTADTINYTLSSSRICSDTKAALSKGKFEGYLGDEINNITFVGEENAAEGAVDEWAKYVEIDGKIRNLEYDSRHDEAVALCVGGSEGQSNYTFAEFDGELEKAITINETNFNVYISRSYRKLNTFPYVILLSLALIILSLIFGLKPRIEEYRA